MKAPARLAAVIVLLAGCGGGGGSSPTPASPSPSPATPVSSACGALGDLAIVNGAECSSGTGPVVLLNTKDSAGAQFGSCSGTIIAPRGILTAAHCLGQGVGGVKVFLGTGTTELTAVSFAANPAYNGNISGDVGVVIMGDDLPRPPMPLLLSRDAHVGETAVIAGWGKDQNQQTASLRAGSATITAVSQSEIHTETTTNFSSVCQGDSGGPLLVLEGGSWALAGIISANTTLACNAGTNFYAPVRNAAVMAFILAHIPDAARK